MDVHGLAGARHDRPAVARRRRGHHLAHWALIAGLGLLLVPATAQAFRARPATTRDNAGMARRHNKQALAAAALGKVASYGSAARQAKVKAAPTAYDLALSAGADADNWWASQGSRPPGPLVLNTNPVTHHGARAETTIGGTTVDVNPKLLDHVNRVLTSRRTNRHQKLDALTTLWGVMAHERGHNIGYDHGVSPLMAAKGLGIPGASFKWARSVLGPPTAADRREPSYVSGHAMRPKRK
jgi:hypothetical protein